MNQLLSVFHSKEADRLLTPEQTRQRLGLKNVNTLAVWRTHKRYPLPWVKIGSKVMYRASDVESFIQSRTIGATA